MSLPPGRRLALAFAMLVLVYGALAALWSVAGDAYAAAYRSLGNAAFGTFFGSGGLVELRPAPPGAAADSVLAVRSRQRLVWGETVHSARLTGYLPTIEVIALVLATPLPWRRRLRALGWALGGVQLFVALRLLLALVHYFNGTEPWSLYALGAPASRLLAAAFELLVVSPTPSFVVPVVIWMAATFRRGDWERLTGGRPRRPRTE